MPELWGRRFGRRELEARVGAMAQVAGVRLLELADGPERGVRVLEFRTGSGFAFEVIVDRACDIGRCEHRGIPLAYLTPVGFPAPAFFDPGGLGFLRSFGGGLLTTCGLDHVGPPVEELDETANPHQATHAHGLHGPISGRPGRLLGYGETWDGDEAVLWMEGEVSQVSFLGEQLVLRRRITAPLGGHCLAVEDRITNAGFEPTAHMLLYHVNVGAPVVEESATVHVSSPTLTPLGDGGGAWMPQLRAPGSGAAEQVFEHAPAAGADGHVLAGVVNPRLGVGVYQRYDPEHLPWQLIWRMERESQYVVGLEPTTNRGAGRLDARRRGELTMLAPGASRSYRLELGVLPDAAACDRFARSVAGDGEATG